MAGTAAAEFKARKDPTLTHGHDGLARRVLYAEDQASARIVTTALLEKMGFEVDAVDDGEVAVDRARNGRYDVILLDIEMPVMDGVTAARIIRAEAHGGKDTPILALSAFLADSTENTLWRDAFDSALPKPANGNELQRAIAKALGQVEAAQHAPVFLPQQKSESGLWQTMQKELPEGTRRMLTQVAASEMHHQALALAAAREAGDEQTIRQTRHTLKGLALNFGFAELANLLDAIAAEPGALNISAAFSMIEEWRRLK